MKAVCWCGTLNCAIQPGDTVAVWGCGPVGLLTVKCAYLLGAERVLAIDRFPERLRMARDKAALCDLNGKLELIAHETGAPAAHMGEPAA